MCSMNLYHCASITTKFNFRTFPVTSQNPCAHLHSTFVPTPLSSRQPLLCFLYLCVYFVNYYFIYSTNEWNHIVFVFSIWLISINVIPLRSFCNKWEAFIFLNLCLFFFWPLYSSCRILVLWLKLDPW